MPASPVAKFCGGCSVCCEDPCSVDAILITHEHSDHIAGIRVLARRLKIPIYITAATYQAYQRLRVTAMAIACRSIAASTSAPAALPDRRHSVTPFTIPHDAVDPVGFTFCADGIKVGICTDLGYMPPMFAIICADATC